VSSVSKREMTTISPWAHRVGMQLSHPHCHAMAASPPGTRPEGGTKWRGLSFVREGRHKIEGDAS